MGDCQDYGPFLGPYYNTGPNTGPNLGDPKRDHNFDNPPNRETLSLSASFEAGCHPGLPGSGRCQCGRGPLQGKAEEREGKKFGRRENRVGRALVRFGALCVLCIVSFEAGANNCFSTSSGMKPWTWPKGKSRAGPSCKKGLHTIFLDFEKSACKAGGSMERAPML